MDALKNRVRVFSGGIMIMVCPVLLAIASDKVNQLKATGKSGTFIRGSISPIAALTLEASIIPFLGLCLSKDLADLCPRLSRYLFGASKLLIHLCALLLMALAYGILLLISMKNLLYLLVFFPFAAITVLRCYWSVQSPVVDEELYHRCVVKLEMSVEFSAAVTTIVFLGLEGLALEGHSISISSSSAHRGLGRMLAASLGFSFVTCVVGVFTMLLGTVPWVIASNGDSANMYCHLVETLNAVLAVAIAINVVLIAAAALKEVAWLLIIPPLVSFLIWIYMVSDDDDDVLAVGGEEEVKPASLELTKVTFTGFLAVSVPTFSDSSLSSYTHAFILLTAAAVITGLGWRLLTHKTESSPAIAKAANIASFCAHLCIAVAVIPFATMAVEALK